MLAGGEQPLYIARRLVRAAVEDVGLADPQAVHQALAAKDVFDFLGAPEGELALAQCVLYLASAPKSNAVYIALGAARARAGAWLADAPAHILNAPTKLMKTLGYGAGYQYDHDAEEGFSGQNYFPDAMARQNFYVPKETGFEREIAKRLDTGQSCARSIAEKADGRGAGGGRRRRAGVAAALFPGRGDPAFLVAGFSVRIFVVNISGGLAMGAIVALGAVKFQLPQELRAFLTVGILGGYTTFSTFSLDSALLIERGDWAQARPMWWVRRCCRSWRCSPACGSCAPCDGRTHLHRAGR